MKQVNISILRSAKRWNRMPLRMLVLMLGLFLSVGAFAQIDVKGHVKDAQGEPIIGATVRVVGTQDATITDYDGNFALKAKQGADISVSYIGYQTQTVKAAASLVITLQDDATLLNDVVVIGYGVARKTDLTGSVTAVKPDEMNRGFVTNAQDLMQGKIAGVNITTAGGAPGGGASIRIRGGSSLNASNDPLIVIDGLAMDNQGVKGLANGLSMVNPNDIESFTVLKDASATAIYGSRGSNGVIIITTKKGRMGQAPQVSYNGNVSISTRRKSLDVMDGNEFRYFVKKYYGEGSDADKLLGNANTDWQDEIYRTAVSTDHNVTISGGLKFMPYRVSLGYTNDQGILKTSSFERYTASVNLSPSLLKDHLKFNINAKAMYAKTRYANTGAVGAAVYYDPTRPVMDSDAKFNNFKGYTEWLQSTEIGSNDNPNGTLKDLSWPYTFNRNTTANPVAMLDLQDDRAKSKSLVGNIEADYAIHGFEDLHVHMNYGLDISEGKQTTVTDIAYPSDAAYYGWNGWDKIVKRNMSYNAYAQYMKDFTKKVHFDIMAGYEWQWFWRSQHYDGWGLLQPTNVEYDAADMTNNYQNRGLGEYKTENYIVSFFGRANFSYDDRYLLTATVRRDGSSRFKEHWATFPSVALAWKIKNEKFLKNFEPLSDLKLRLGYGQTGQQEGIGDYTYFITYKKNTRTDSYYPVAGDGSTLSPQAYNQNLKWETTTTWNAGLDVGFFDQRLTASVDFYYRKTTDLLNDIFVDAGTNFSNKTKANIGSLKNTGVEIAINYKPFSYDNPLQWDLGFNVTYNKNKITELIGEDNYYVPTGGISSGTGNYAQAHAVGYPASSFYVFQQVYDVNGLPIEGVYVDRNGDGKITTDDKYFYKSPAAPWTFGFTSKLMYKNWDFSFSLRAKLGNYVYNDQEAGFSNISKVYDASFSYLTNRPYNVLPKNWQTYDNALSDYFVHNASFLKCDNITLGYSFNNLFKTGGWHGLSGRIYANVSNVFTITKYEGIDPEVDGGIDNNMYPRPFTAQLGLSLNF